MSFTSKAKLKKENLRLKSEVEELKNKVYENSRSIGCFFCKHAMTVKRDGKFLVCCEFEQRKFCDQFVKRS